MPPLSSHEPGLQPACWRAAQIRHRQRYGACTFTAKRGDCSEGRSARSVTSPASFLQRCRPLWVIIPVTAEHRAS
jgi:hypothetical protein